MKTSRMISWSVSILTLLSLTSCSGEKDVVQEVIRPVRFAQVFATGGTRVRTFSGVAQAAVESKLSFKVPGTVQLISVSVGDFITEGAVIAKLDNKDYTLQLQEAEAALAQSQAQQRNAESIYERVQGLYENRNASKQDIDSARAAAESARAQVTSIENRLALAQLQLNYTSLTAPFDGAVASVAVEENENIAAGMMVVMLNAGGPQEVKVTVPEMLISQIHPGSVVEVTFGALDDIVLPATVTEVGVSSSEYTTTYPVTAQLSQPHESVRPGMVAEVAFTFETAGTLDCMIVPPHAVGEDRVGRFVFLIEPAGENLGIARRTAVVIGELTGEGLEIISGVEEGDLVITAGVSRVNDGQKVKVL